MKNNKKKEKNKKLFSLLGIDLCACGASHTLKCFGICRETHINPKTKIVKCTSLYQIDVTELKTNKKKENIFKKLRKTKRERNFDYDLDSNQGV